MRTERWLAMVATSALACGARTELRGGGDAALGAPDASADRRADARADAGGEADVSPPGCTTTTDDPSFGATESLDTCSEGQNTSFPLDTNCGGTSVAWEYVPAHDLDVTRLELDVTGGGVALYDNVAGAPGAKLFEGAFDSGPQTWRGVAVSPPIHLVGCHVYFIQQITPDGGAACSIATGGTPQRQFNPPGFGGSSGWTGPYIWLPWSARVLGTCP